MTIYVLWRACVREIDCTSTSLIHGHAVYGYSICIESYKPLFPYFVSTCRADLCMKSNAALLLCCMQIYEEVCRFMSSYCINTSAVASLASHFTGTSSLTNTTGKLQNVSYFFISLFYDQKLTHGFYCCVYRLLHTNFTWITGVLYLECYITLLFHGVIFHHKFQRASNCFSFILLVLATFW